MNVIVRTYRSGSGSRAGFGITYERGSYGIRPFVTVLVWRRVWRIILTGRHG